MNIKYNGKIEYLPDSKAFVFSLNQKKKFISNDENKSIELYPNYCIMFGNGYSALAIGNNILKSNYHWSNPNSSYGSNLNLTEDNFFSIIEFEVFYVSF